MKGNNDQDERNMPEHSDNPDGPSLMSLPEDLLISIMERVASVSISDLLSLKQCCIRLTELGMTHCILRHANVDRFPIPPGRNYERASWFLEACAIVGNHEAIFKEGIRLLFDCKEREWGLRKLERAVIRGHVESTYVYGIVLFCCRREDKRAEALNILSRLDTSGLSMRAYRRRVQELISKMSFTMNAIRDMIFGDRGQREGHSSTPRSCDCWRIDGPAWEGNDYGYCCSKACFWEREAAIFIEYIDKFAIRMLYEK